MSVLISESDKMDDDIKDIKKRSGDYCPISERKCSDTCRFKDKITGECLFWLMNSNLYHIRQTVEEARDDIKEIKSKLEM